MIKLDKWESQFIYLAKGWFSSEKYESISLEEKLYLIWKDRTDVLFNEPMEVLPYVNTFLIRLLQKVEPNFKLERLLNLLAPVGMFNHVYYTDNKGYSLRVCTVILDHYLSILQIREDDYVLIELEEKDFSIFDKYLEEEEEEENE